MPRIAQIFRYPVKGLSPEPKDSVDLTTGREIPGDRAYAIAHGSTVFDPARPQHLPKDKFLMLMRNEKLAALRTRYNDATSELIVERNGKVVARGRLDQPVGRQMLEQFFAAYLRDEVRGSPRIVRAEGHTFSDVPLACLSLINISSVRELERVMGRHIDPLRFRGNLYFDTGMPWQEFDWVGKRIVIQGAGSSVVLEGVERITRCAATNVDPETGARDLNVPKTLQRAFGHADLGIYAKVVEGGRIAVRDSLGVE